MEYEIQYDKIYKMSSIYPWPNKREPIRSMTLSYTMDTTDSEKALKRPLWTAPFNKNFFNTLIDVLLRDKLKGYFVFSKSLDSELNIHI